MGVNKKVIDINKVKNILYIAYISMSIWFI